MEKKIKEKNIIVLVIVLIIVLLIFSLARRDTLSTRLKTEDLDIQTKLYKDNSLKGLSVIGGLLVNQIQFKVMVSNTDVKQMTATIDAADSYEVGTTTLKGDSTAFMNSLVTKPPLVINPGQSAEWVSDPIPTSSFESLTATTFIVCVIGTIAYTPFDIVVDRCASVDIQISPNPVCGNNLKETGELCDGTDIGTNTCASVLGVGYTGTLGCSAGCNSWDTTLCVAPTYIRFRTFDFTYSSSSNAVAFSSTCGGTLVAYGATAGACTSVSCLATNQLLNIPDVGGMAKLWVDGSRLCICDSTTAGSLARSYTTSDSDASLVSINPNPIDSAKELTC